MTTNSVPGPPWISPSTLRGCRRRLVIAAKCREPDEWAYHRQVIETLLDDRVSYVGEVDHARKVELLQGVDVLLNPIQWREPFGLVMVEALACGTPVVAAPNGTASEIVDHGRTAYLAASVDDLAASIEAVYGGAIDRRRCRHHAVTHYSMQAMAREHEHFYRNVLTRRAADHAATVGLAGSSRLW